MEHRPGKSDETDADFDRSLRQAVENGQIHVHVQPIVRLSSNEVVKVEALARWDHAILGAVAPEVFIAAAERSGVIGHLGHQVLRAACDQAAKWRRDAHPGMEMTVNLSAVQLADPDLVGQVQRVLADSGLSPHALWLEVTEIALIENLDQAETTLRQLHLMGVRIAIDDFGTGYASLSYLKRFPVQALKIDQGFVSGVVDDPGDRAIVRSVLHLGRELGLTVVAEGVENVDQMEALGGLGCRLGQGFLFGHPVASTDASWEGTVRRRSLPALEGVASSISESPAEARARALHESGVLEGGPTPGFDAVVSVAAALFGAPVAMLSMFDCDRQRIVAETGLGMREAPLDWGPSRDVVSSTEAVVVSDALADP